MDRTLDKFAVTNPAPPTTLIDEGNGRPFRLPDQDKGQGTNKGKRQREDIHERR
jgi:hypothetical protein